MRQFGPYLLQVKAGAGVCGRTRGARATRRWCGGCGLAASRAATRGTENRWRQLKRKAGPPSLVGAAADKPKPARPRGVRPGAGPGGGAGVCPTRRAASQTPLWRLAPLVGKFDYGLGRMRAERLTHASLAPAPWGRGGLGVRKT